MNDLYSIKVSCSDTGYPLCLDEECPLKRECKYHDSAGDYRTDDGIDGGIVKINEQWKCSKEERGNDLIEDKIHNFLGRELKPWLLYDKDYLIKQIQKAIRLGMFISSHAIEILDDPEPITSALENLKKALKKLNDSKPN